MPFLDPVQYVTKVDKVLYLITVLTHNLGFMHF